MHNVQVVLPPKLNINFKFDQYNNFGENILEPGHYCTEGGRILYDDSPQPDAEAAVVNNVCSNATDGSEDRNISSSGSSEPLPTTARWSPATATTTVTAGCDDEDVDGGSSSSKRHLIPPTKLPIADKRDGENSDKSAEDDLSPVAPTEPVPMFFTMPDMPPLPPPNAVTATVRVTPRNWDSGPRVNGNSGYYKDPRSGGGVAVVRGNQGYQDSGMIAVANNQNHDRPVAPNRLHYRHAVAVSVDCLVGDQRQSRDKTGIMPVQQRRAGNHPLPAPPLVPLLSPSLPSVSAGCLVGNQQRTLRDMAGGMLVQPRCAGNQPLPSPLLSPLLSPSRPSTTDDDSTESRPSTDDDLNNHKYQREREDGTSSPPPPRPPSPPPLYELSDATHNTFSRPAPQLRKPNNGYCDKNMLIVGPAVGDLARNNGHEPQQQQPLLLSPERLKPPPLGQFTQQLRQTPWQFSPPLLRPPEQFSEPLKQPLEQSPEPQQLPPEQSPEPQTPPSRQRPEPQQPPSGQSLQSPEPQQPPPGRSPEVQQPPQEQSPEPQQPTPEQSPELEKLPPEQSPQPEQPPPEQSPQSPQHPHQQPTVDIVPDTSSKSYVTLDIAAKEKRLSDLGRLSGYVRTVPGGIEAVASAKPDTATDATEDHGLATRSDHHNIVQVAVPT